MQPIILKKDYYNYYQITESIIKGKHASSNNFHHSKITSSKSKEIQAQSDQTNLTISEAADTISGYNISFKALTVVTSIHITDNCRRKPSHK